MNRGLKYLLLSALSMLIFYSSASAQKFNIDSLETILKTQGKDTFRINTLNLLSELLLFNTDSLERGKLMAQEALRLSQTLIKSADSINARALRKKEGDAYNNLGYHADRLDEFENSLDYYFKSLAIRKELGLKRQSAGSLNNIAVIYLNKGKFEDALKYVLEALKINEEIGNIAWAARNHSVIGRLQNEMNHYQEALDSYKSALKLFTEKGDRKAIATSNINIGNCYLNLKNNASAITHFKIALDIPELRNRDKVFAYNGLGNILLKKDSLEEALNYYLLASDIFDEVPDREGYEDVNINIGKIYTRKGQFDLAERYFLNALNYGKKIESNITIRNSLDHLSRWAAAKEDYKKAFEYQSEYLLLKDSLLNQENNKAVNELKLIYDTEKKDNEIKLLEKEKSLRDLRVSQQEQLLYISKYKDSQQQAQLELAEEKQKLSYLEANQLSTELSNQKLQKEKFLAENTILLKDQVLKTTSLIRQKQYRNAAIIFSCLVLFIAFLLYSRYTSKKKYSEILENKNLIIEKEKLNAIKSEEYKSQFLANMSHEIRTPLHAITGMINVLREKDPRDDQKAYLNVMSKSSESLIGILNNVLDLSKIEAGKIVFEKNVFSPEECLRNVTNILHAGASDKNLVLETQLINLPDRVIGDEVRLTQILINIISNAIKFTEKGGVYITCKSTPGSSREKDKLALTFSIRDTGIGIESPYLSSVFEKFVQADASTTRKFGGTGLGLSISKQLVELQNGTIEVKSERGKGSEFIISIPYSVAGIEDAIVLENYKLKAVALNGISILYAEDNQYNQIVARETLAYVAEGISIDMAENGKIAIEKLQNTNYDIILMDLQMPVMDGYQAATYIRNNLTTPKNRIPIIAVSANATHEEKLKCINAGMNDYLPKPFHPKDIVDVLVKALQTTHKI
ncbi:MAG: tetratricopeptide repeat protein [Bacteroidetes bacterium]|nr:tetratricopeptide repeat protein [Bacteroidota bacterium]